jgi:hypothetical protein
MSREVSVDDLPQITPCRFFKALLLAPFQWNHAEVKNRLFVAHVDFLATP